MLIHGNPRAEQTEPRIRSARFGIGRDETEHRPTLLGRTEIETEHPLAPRDESEQYSISVRSVRSQAWPWLIIISSKLRISNLAVGHGLILSIFSSWILQILPRTMMMVLRRIPFLI